MCGAAVLMGEGYVVRIDVYADPEMPQMTGDQIASADLNATLAEVIREAEKMSAEDLQDGVHRRFEYRLCPKCHRAYLANPLGMPRQVRVGRN